MIEIPSDFQESLDELNKAFDYYSFATLTKMVYQKARTPELLEIANEKTEELKLYLEKTNSKFKIESNAFKNQSLTNCPIETKFNAIITSAELEAKAILDNSKLDKWIDDHRILKNKEEKLWCPICRNKDSFHNTINDEPFCVRCMHKLVPKPELVNYNRNYRRKWRKII